jgi:DUF4097 and DUF4098 domain-containing protein YvlB
MASPVAPPPVVPPPQRQRSFAGPVVLILLGILFLMGTMGMLHWGTLAHVFARFWPVLLIIWGVIKFLEYQQAQRAGVRPRGIGVGGVFLIIFLVVAGLIATQAAKVNWNAIGDEINIDGEDFPMFGNSYEYSDDLEQAFPAGGSLRVNVERGAVTINASNDNKIHVSVHKRIRADKQEDADKYNTQTKPEISVNDKIFTINGNTNGAGEHGVTTDMDITMPRKADVVITSHRGDVDITDREGNLQITTQRGTVSLENITGNVELNLSGTSVRAEKIGGDFAIDGRASEVTLSEIKGSVRLNGEFMERVHLAKVDKTVSFRSSRTDMEFSKLDGDLDLDSKDLRASSLTGPMRLTTRSKDIQLEQLAGDLRLQDSNGEVNVSFSSLGSVQIENRKGDIDVAIPSKATFHVEARSRGGDIDTEFSELKVEENHSDHSVNGNVGEGGPRIVINNEHGNITLRRESVSVPIPPTPSTPPALNRGKTPKPAAPAKPAPDVTEN